MDRGFFRSREFLVTGILAFVLVAGWAGALTYSVLRGPSLEATECSAAQLPGNPIDAEEAEDLTPRGDASARLVRRYDLSLAGLTGGAIDLCTEVGPITIEPSPDDGVHLVTTLLATGPDAAALAREVDLDVAFSRQGDRLHLHARQMEGIDEWGFLSLIDRDVEVVLTLQVPPGAGFNLTALAAVGEISVRDLTLGSLAVRTQVGEVTATNVTVLGATDLRTETGEVTFGARQVTGAVTVTTEVGEVNLTLPRLESTGYRFLVVTEVGDIHDDLGPSTEYRKEEETPGYRLDATTPGANRIAVNVTTEVGDVTLRTVAVP